MVTKSVATTLEATTTLEAPTPADSRGLPSWLPVTGLMIVAFVFRLVLGHYFQQLTGDAPEYTSLAHNLAAGHGYSTVSAPPYLASDVRLPGYPAVLALAFVFNSSHGAVVVLNALLGALSTLLVWMIARALNLSSALALAAAGISALFFSTASWAGVAYSENLTMPALLAFVYVVLLKPPRSRLVLFGLGSALAWTVALTRYELVFFVILAGVIAGRFAKLRPLASIALVGCFLVGPAVWVVRNDIQVHRIEYGDSVIADQGLLMTVIPKLGSPLQLHGDELLLHRQITPQQRSQYQSQTLNSLHSYLSHHFPAYLEHKVGSAIEYPFPPPIATLTYSKGGIFFARLAWSFLLLAGYAFALFAGWRWWTRGHRRKVVALGLFPVFAFCLVPFIDAVQRYWLPSLLFLLPAALKGASDFVVELRIRLRGVAPRPALDMAEPLQ